MSAATRPQETLVGQNLGAGDTRTPTLINLFCLWLREIPLAWVLAHPFGFGPTGVFIAVSVAFSTMALISGGLFSMGMLEIEESLTRRLAHVEVARPRESGRREGSSLSY